MEQGHKIVVLGLDNAGKTTLLNYMKEGKVLEDSEPTRTFDVMDFFMEELKFFIWDAPGQELYRERWADGLAKTEIVLFILDCAVKERFKEAKRELDRVLNELTTPELPVLVCFHKMDIEVAQENMEEALEMLNLSEINNRQVNWIKTSVYSNEGIEDLKMLMFKLLALLETKREIDSIQERYSS